MEDPVELENYWSIIRPDQSPAGSPTMHVGEALERLTRSLRRYYDVTGYESEVFTITLDNDGHNPVKFRVRILCQKGTDNIKEWEPHNKGPFHDTIEGATDAAFRAVVAQILDETQGWVVEAQAVEKKLHQFNEIIAELRRNVKEMGVYQPPQAVLPFEKSVEEDDDDDDNIENNGPASSVC